MTTHTYRCPFGATTLRASNAKSLRDKILTHNLTAHGPYPIIVCGAAPMRPEYRPAPQPATRFVTRRLEGLSGRGI